MWLRYEWNKENNQQVISDAIAKYGIDIFETELKEDIRCIMLDTIAYVDFEGEKEINECITKLYDCFMNTAVNYDREE